MTLKKLYFAALLSIFLSFLLGACTSDKDETLKIAPQIAKDQRQALDKAKTVNGTVIQQTDEQRKHIDSETQ